MFLELLKNDTFRKTMLFLMFIVLFLWFIFSNIDLAITLFVSLVFACSLSPLVDKMEKKINRGIATAIVLFGALAILALLVIYVISLGINQIGTFVSSFPHYLNDLEGLVKTIPVLKGLQLGQMNLESFVSPIAATSSSFISGAMGFLNEMGTGFIYSVAALIFIFFLIKDKNTIKATLLTYFPEDLKARTEEIINSIAQKIGGYVVAQTMAIGSVWFVMTLGLMLFNIEYAISFGMIVGIMDIIPVIGPAIALVICLLASFELGIKTVIIVTVVFVVAQLIENNFVRPYAFGKLMNLHPIIIFLSLILGAKYLGVIGILFAPAIAATIVVLLNELYVNNLK